MLGASQSWEIDNLTANALTVSGAISSVGTTVLTKTGTGALILGGANTFNGGLVIANGTVIANVSSVTTASGAAGPSANAITLGSATSNSATLLANSFTVANAINLASGNSGTLTIGNNGGATAAVFGGNIALNGNTLNISATGTGSTTLNGSITGSSVNFNMVAASSITLTALSPSFTSPINVSVGTLNANAATAGNSFTVLGTGQINLSGGTLKVKDNGTGAAQQIITGNGTTGNNVVVTGSTTIDVNNNGANVGSGFVFNNLSVTGATLNVTGANAYVANIAGTTTLNAGTIFNPTTASLNLVGAVNDSGNGATITGATGVRLLNTSTVTANAISGTLTVNGGVLQGFASAAGSAVSSSDSFGTATIALTGTTPTLRLTPAIAGSLTVAPTAGLAAKGYSTGAPASLAATNFLGASQAISGMSGVYAYLNIAASGATVANIPANGAATFNVNTSFQFTGLLKITTAGMYNFSNATDDQGNLFVDGNAPIVTNVTTANNAFYLTAGLHVITERMNNSASNGQVSLSYQGPDQAALAAIPASVLFNATVAQMTTTFANNITIGAGVTGTVDIASNVILSGNTSFTGTGGTLSVTGSGDVNTLIVNNLVTNGTSTLSPSTTAVLSVVNATGSAGGTDTLVLNGTDVVSSLYSPGNQITGVIANGAGGTLGLKVTGDTWTLTGTSNSYTGGTVLTGGVLSIAADASLGLSSNVLNFNGGALQVTGTTLNNFTTRTVTFTTGVNVILDINNASNTFTLDKNVTNGAGLITKNGAGTLILSGNNNYTGGTVVNTGTLKAGSANGVSSGGALTLAGTSIFDLNGNNVSVTTLTDVATASITDSATGAGTDTLKLTAQAAAINSLISNGTTRTVAVQLANTNTNFALTNNGNTFSGGLTLLNNGTGTRLGIIVAPTTTGSAGAITSSPFGTGTITIGQVATDKAGIYISVANATIANAITFNTALGTDRTGIRVDTTGNILSGTITANLANATFSQNGAGAGSVSLTGQVTGPQGLTLDGSNQLSTLTVTLNNATANANNYQGTTTIGLNILAAKTMILSMGAANQIPNGSTAGNVILSTSTTGVPTLNLNGFSQSINGLSAVGTSVSTAIVDGVSGTPTLTLGGNNATASFNGTIKNTAGTLSLTKVGTGTQTLAGVNSYTGLTTVSAGALTVSGVGSLSGSSSLTVSAGATFNFNPTLAAANITQTVAGLTLANGSTIGFSWNANGNSSILSAPTATTSSGTVYLNPTGAFNGNGTTTYTVLSSSGGDLQNGGLTSYQVLNPTNFTAVISQSANLVTITPTTVTALTGNVYWLGGLANAPMMWAVSTGADSNWTPTAGATPVHQGLVPGAGADVVFSNSTALAANQVGMTLGASMSIKSLTVSSANPVSLNADGNTLTIAGASGITVASGAGQVNLNSAIILGVVQTWTNNNTANTFNVGGNISAGVTLTLANAASTNTSISGIISGVGGLSVTGAGTATLSAANSYNGTTTIDQGTLRFTADQATSGALTFGLAALSTKPGTLDLSTTPSNATFAALLVQTTATTNAPTNTITIGTGKTLTQTGAVTIGSGTTTTNFTSLTISGAGSYSIGTATTSTNANIQLGVNNTTNISNAGILDMSGLTNFTAYLGTGNLLVGETTNAGGTGTAGSTLKLAANSTITAATISSDSVDGDNTQAVKQSIVLGTGTNVFNANTINIGAATNRAIGTLNFATGSGTLQIRNELGAINAAVLNVAYGNTTTGFNSTATVVDLTGHSADLSLASLNIGGRTATTAASGSSAGVMKFDTGSLNSTAVTIGLRGGVATTASGNATGDLQIGGGATFIVGTGGIQLGINSTTTTGQSATGSLELSGASIATVGATSNVSITLGKSATATDVATATLSITGTSSLTLAGDLIKGTGNGSASVTSTLTLNGGTLNMGGFTIGSGGLGAGLAINTLNFQSGTLQNVSQINSGAGLAKTTSGTLTIAGTNAYTGATLVNAGTLNVTGTTASGSNFTVGGNGTSSAPTLTGTGIIGGSVTIASAGTGVAGTLNPGTVGSVGTLSTGAVTFNSGSTFAIDLGAGSNNADKLVITGAATISSGALDKLQSAFDARSRQVRIGDGHQRFEFGRLHINHNPDRLQRSSHFDRVGLDPQGDSDLYRPDHHGG